GAVAGRLEQRRGPARAVDIAVQVDIPRSDARFDSNVELHIFRIIEQASENALRHSQTDKLHIFGDIESDRIHLTVEDDGDGFVVDPGIDLVNLLEKKHFGLASMIERATLINAEVEINSETQKGTRVSVRWSQP
ncbi:MAG: hypothetical protein IH859_08480, partial [Chloroflexi bacterium]|nr:hypothetical protein [Chloroflexota bacterium]